jgi:hypothetical protein
VHALARERVEVHGQHRRERLALAGLHLGDVAEVQRGAPHQLHGERALTDRALRGLADHGERLGEQLVERLGGVVGHPVDALVGQLVHDERLAREEPLLDLSAPPAAVAQRELDGLGAQRGVGELLDLGLQRLDVLGYAREPLHQLRLTGAEQAVKERHGSTSFTIAVRRRSASCPPRVAKHPGITLTTPEGRSPFRWIRGPPLRESVCSSG